MKYFFPQRKLTNTEWLLICEALWELSIARLKVSMLPSKKYLPQSSGNHKYFSTPEKFGSGKTISAVINGLSSRTPWQSTCLVKLLAANKMLTKRQIPHTMHFGVKKNSLYGFDAHAWLSLEKLVTIGGEKLYLYQEISRIIV